MNHATSNCLLLLEVVLFLGTLRDSSHQLEVHEAALCIGVGLGGHQRHCFLVLVEVGVLSMLWTLFDHRSVSLKTLPTLKVLVMFVA